MGIANNNADPSLYVSAYQHAHHVVEADAPYNEPAGAYPGDKYVDWIGIDGYNWGFGPSWDPTGDHWTSFDATFATAYAKARSVAPNKPVMLAWLVRSGRRSPPHRTGSCRPR